MRVTVVGWSAVGGVLLGLFIDVFLVGVAMIAAFAVPGLGRSMPRWALLGATALCAMIPIVAGFLGLLEGRLKLR